MRCPGLKELTDLIDARTEQIKLLLPEWWGLERKNEVMDSFPGKVLIHAVVAVIYMELRRIEYEDQE